MTRKRVGYRDQARDGKRQPRGRLRYTDTEWAAIAVAASREAMTPGAWAQDAAYDAAVRANVGPVADPSTVGLLLEELRQHRRVLTNVGGNLNDVARVANSTSELTTAAAALATLALVRRVVSASDRLVVDMRTRLLR